MIWSTASSVGPQWGASHPPVQSAALGWDAGVSSRNHPMGWTVAGLMAWDVVFEEIFCGSLPLLLRQYALLSFYLILSLVFLFILSYCIAFILLDHVTFLLRFESRGMMSQEHWFPSRVQGSIAFQDIPWASISFHAMSFLCACLDTSLWYI